ncbi:hypothetical protein EI372_07865 [Vibrio fluvialis]|nr:hypothetical protein [Vibrio fluvialis]
MPSIQVTGVLEDPITGVESDAEIRIISKINYGQTTKNSDSIAVLSSSGVYDFQLVYGKHLIAVKSKDSQVFTNIGTVVVGEGSPSPIDIITLIATSSEEPDPILITQLQLIAAEAAASADEAAQSALNAADSATAAAQSEADAYLSASNANNSALSASTSEANAANSESSAESSATNAAQSETNAANSAASAQASANNAAQSEDNASNSANAAALSETNAAQSAASASDDADRAEAAALTASSGVIDRGSWDASTGSFPTPTLTPEERTDWYRISVAGVMSDGVQPDIDASIGDNLYWDKQNDVWYKIDNTDKVNSVNGKEGDVVLDASDFDDIYSKTEVDNALFSKANSSDVYQKDETYSQTEVDSMLSASAEASFIKYNLFRGMPMSAVGPVPDPDIFLPAGRVELNRADYPTVFGIVSASAFYTSQATIDADPRQYAGYWGDGDGVNTFTTDDWALMMNIKVAGGYGAAGSTKEDHIQNITGDFQIATSGSSSQIIRTANGAFSKNNPGGLGTYPNIASTESGVAYNMNFNAALSARTSDITDTMGLFLDHYRVIPKGVFSYA